MVLLSITPLLDGVLRRDIIAPFHTSGPPLLQFHLAIEQWGYTTNNNGTWALNFNTVLSAVVTGSPGYPAREFCGFNFNYTMTGWSFNAGYGSPVTYLNGVCVSAIAIGF